MDDRERRTALGRAVIARRKELGLDQKDLTELGGPSVATIRKIEGGAPGSYQLKTTWPLERALGWRPGSIEAFLRGGTGDLLPAVAVTPNYSALRTASDQEPRQMSDVQLVSAISGLTAELGRRLAELRTGRPSPAADSTTNSRPESLIDRARRRAAEAAAEGLSDGDVRTPESRKAASQPEGEEIGVDQIPDT